MKIVILTIVVALYTGNDLISTKWITMHIDSQQDCLAIAETMNTNTIIDDRSEWDGNRYDISAFCGAEIVGEKENENN